MVNLGALNWFDSFIKTLKKALDSINHVIYTPEDGVPPRCLILMLFAFLSYLFVESHTIDISIISI